MKKRIFFWQHLAQFFLLARIYHIQFIPLHLFAVLTLALFKLKHQIQGVNFITYGLVVFYLVEMIGEIVGWWVLQYLGSVCGGLLFLLPIRFYWLPEYNQLIGFRHDEVDSRHYFEFYPIRDDDEAVRVKSLKWCSGIEKQKLVQNLHIANPLLAQLAYLSLSFTDKVKFFYGEGLTEKTEANIIFSHGKGATPLFYSCLMRHFASKKYRVGGIQHTEQSYIWKKDIESVRQFRQKQVINRAQQIHRVIDEQLYSDRMVLMGHSYGCATVLQAYHTLRKQIKDKITHLVLVDPWLFPLTQEVIDKHVDVPVLILANQDFVNYREVYKLNLEFAQKHRTDYIIWKGAEHKHQTDFGYIFGNYLRIMKNSSDTDLYHTLNYEAIDKFLKGEKVEGTYGDRQCGRDYKPQIFHKDDYLKW